MIFEQATLADADQLLQLRLGYLTDDFGQLSKAEHSSVAAELPSYLANHLGQDLFAYVARDGEQGTIVSCAWLLLVEKPPSPRFPRGRTGTIFNVYTQPGHRRQGLAKHVMGLLIDDARRRDLDVIELHATDDGYPLYRILGFDDDSSTHVAMRMML